MRGQESCRCGCRSAVISPSSSAAAATAIAIAGFLAAAFDDEHDVAVERKEREARQQVEEKERYVEVDERPLFARVYHAHGDVCGELLMK